MKRGACQHAKRAAPFWGTALRLDLGCTRSGGLFHALSGGTACFQLLLETAAGLEAGDGGGLQTAGDLGLGVGVSLGLAGTHLKTAKAGNGHLLVCTQAVSDLVKQSVHRGLDLCFGKAGLARHGFDHLGTSHCIDILLERPKVTSFGKFCVVEYNKCSPSLREIAHETHNIAHELHFARYFL